MSVDSRRATRLCLRGAVPPCDGAVPPRDAVVGRQRWVRVRTGTVLRVRTGTRLAALIVVLALVGTVVGVGAGAARATQASAVAPLPYHLVGVEGATKVLTVTSPSWSSTTATAVAWERTPDGLGWRQVGGPWPATVGYGGWAFTPGEATGRSPVGSFSFGTGFGLAGNPGYRLGWFDVGPTDYWVEDPAAGLAYNTRQQGPVDPRQAPWGHFERLADYPVQYRYAALINFNVPVSGTGRGSGIFLHVSTGGPTAGCVGLETDALLWVLRWIDAGTRIVMGPTDAVTRGPGSEIERAWWNLPSDPGAPTSPEWQTPNRPGAFRHFGSGSLYWSAATGAHWVSGPIRDRWASLGWEDGPLGFPLIDVAQTPAAPGAFVHFQHGSIYWSPVAGAHAVSGVIRDRWAELGWEQGRLGFPTSDAVTDAAGTEQRFTGGAVFAPSGATGQAVRVGYVPTASEQRADAVRSLYVQALGRQPDAAGSAYWTGLLTRGMRFADVAAALWSSPEAFARTGTSPGSATPQTWTAAVYQGLLGRAPDGNGLAWWAAVAARDRPGVVRAIYDAPESVARRVDAAYLATLGRAPDAAGRTYWQTQLPALGDAVLFDVLGHSPEAFARLVAALRAG